MMKHLKNFLIVLCLCVQSLSAQAAIDAELLKPLAGDDPALRIEAVNEIAALASDDAFKVLQAMRNYGLYATPEGQVLVVDGNRAWNPVNGETTDVPEEAQAITVNNRLRRVLDSALSGFRLFSPDPQARMAAAQAVRRAASVEQMPLIERALEKESDARIRTVLQMAAAVANLEAQESATRRKAIQMLAESTDASLLPRLQQFLDKNPDGSFAETDPDVRTAAQATIGKIKSRIKRNDLIANLFYGVSLGSVLLLAALGLAITFGLMGIINMAHGELLMIGAYTTFMVQWVFRQYFPGALDAYLLAALPAAFLVAGAVGIALERTVIRWLYGRPLETLLATWGISLILMQTVRSIFGAQNVEVANPSWMSGGITVLGSVVLTWNRIVIIAFALFVVGVVWIVLNRTRLGLFVRAVTQNRRMADCNGVKTGRVDMLTFGLGSGIAGLGGVALSQLGNVGPDLGQAYFIDSFMVVVLGGVGNLAGTVIAAFGLGAINKFLEPVSGAVLAKIAILVFIIIFIQKRPQGLFAMKGRSAE